MKPQTTNPTSPNIGVDEAAEILRCGAGAVQKLISIGELPALEMNQRSTVLPREDVNDYVRVKAREQAKVRKVQHARSIAPRPVAPVPPAKPVGVRRHRPLPDWTLATSPMESAQSRGLAGSGWHWRIWMSMNDRTLNNCYWTPWRVTLALSSPTAPHSSAPARAV